MSNNSTPLKIKAKLGFHGVLDSEVVKALGVAYNALLHNPAFPNPPVDLSVYKAGIDTLASLVVDAEDGGTKAIKAKDKQRIAMIKMYTLLGHYAEGACNDDPAIFSTSGFTPVTNVRAAAKPLTEAKFSSIDRGSNSGGIVVKPESQPGVLTFDVRFALESAGSCARSLDGSYDCRSEEDHHHWPDRTGNVSLPDPRVRQSRRLHRLDGQQDIHLSVML